LPSISPDEQQFAISPRSSRISERQMTKQRPIKGGPCYPFSDRRVMRELILIQEMILRFIASNGLSGPGIFLDERSLLCFPSDGGNGEMISVIK
jgi:hypothetical protein